MCNYSNENCNRKKKELFTVLLPLLLFELHRVCFCSTSGLGLYWSRRAENKCSSTRLTSAAFTCWKRGIEWCEKEKINTFPPAQWPQAWVHTRRGRVQVCPPPVGDTVVSYTAESSESKVMWWVSNTDVTWKCEGDETSSLTVTDYNATEGAANIGYNNLHTLSLATPEGCIAER